MTTTLVQINNPRSSFHGCWRFALVNGGRVLWQSNPGSKEWAECNAKRLWPTLDQV